MLDNAPPLPLRLTVTYCRQPQQQQGGETFFYSTAFTAFSLDCVSEQPPQPWAQTQQQATAGASASLADIGGRAVSQHRQQQHTQISASQPASQATVEYHTHPVSQPHSQRGPSARLGSAGVLSPLDRQSSVATSHLAAPAPHGVQALAPSGGSQSGAARTAQQTIEVRICRLCACCAVLSCSAEP